MDTPIYEPQSKLLVKLKDLEIWWLPLHFSYYLLLFWWLPRMSGPLLINMSLILTVAHMDRGLQLLQGILNPKPMSANLLLQSLTFNVP